MKRRIALFGVALVAAATAWTYTSYRASLDEAHARIAQGSAVVDTPCGRIEYARIGAGPPILLVHGAGGGFDQGIDFGEDLVRQGFEVIAMSRFGYLRTPLPTDASAAAQADAHACLLDSLGIGSVAVLGASAGAPSATLLALRHPSRASALVLLVPAMYAPETGGALAIHAPGTTQLFFDTALRSDLLFWLATRIARRTLSHAILATPSAVIDAASAEEKVRVRTMIEHILPVSARRLGLVNDAAVTSRLARYDLERVRTPTLVVSVQDDLFGTFAPARYTASQIPGARSLAFRTGGHVWVGHHQEVVRALTDFLRGVRPLESSSDGK